MKRSLRAHVIVALLAGAFALFACSSDSDNEAAACDDIAELTEAISEACNTLTVDSTVDEVTGAREKILSAREDALNSLGKVADDRRDEL